MPITTDTITMKSTAGAEVIMLDVKGERDILSANVHLRPENEAEIEAFRTLCENNSENVNHFPGSANPFTSFSVDMLGMSYTIYGPLLDKPE